MSLKKNLLKNGIASAIQKGVRVFEQLLLVPFFITAWGASYYGEWLTLTIIPSMLAFSEFGLGTSAGNSLILLYCDNKKQEAANVAKSGFVMVTTLIFVGILMSVVALYVLNTFHVFDKSLIKTHDAVISVGMLMIARILNFYTPLYRAYYSAARKASISMNMDSAFRVLVLLGGIAVLYFGGGVILFALTNLTLTIIFIPIYIIVAYKILGLHLTHKGKVLRSDIKIVAIKGFGFFLSPIWQALYFQGITFIVRLLLGPVAVTIFNTTRTISRSIIQVFNMIGSTIYYDLQYEIGLKNFNKARKLFRFGLTISFFIALLGELFLILFGPWFYEIWTKKSIELPLLLWYILTISVGLHSIWWMCTIVFEAVNKPYSLTITGIISSVLSLVVSYLLGSIYGLTGIGIGYIVLDISMLIVLFPLSCKELNQSIPNLIFESLRDLKLYLIDYSNIILKQKVKKTKNNTFV